MTGRVNFPSYLYIRVDRPLRAALVCAAEAAGVTVSDLARRELRKALTDGSERLQPHHSHGDRP